MQSKRIYLWVWLRFSTALGGLCHAARPRFWAYGVGVYWTLEKTD